MKNNKNNKGFTMVELIIVIAILAILMVALVPQFIKYVDSARLSNDMQVAAGIESAAEVAVIDPANDITLADGETLTITWLPTGTFSVGYNGATTTSDYGTVMEDAIVEVTGTLPAATSNTAKNVTTGYVLVIKADGGTYTFDEKWTGIID